MSGNMKRNPAYFRDFRKGGTYARFYRLSKSDWADVFCDLYRQAFGDDALPQEILDDAERRLALLKAQGIR